MGKSPSQLRTAGARRLSLVAMRSPTPSRAAIGARWSRDVGCLEDAGRTKGRKRPLDLLPTPAL